jgi:DNA-binding NarL/FixJ family response regulator
MSLGILIADDQTIPREGLKTLLEGVGFNVVGEAASGAEASRLASNLRPDIAILDLPLASETLGLEAAREIAQASPSTKPILLTDRAHEPYVVECLRAGVRGYVLKSQAVNDLIQAIRDVARGALYLSPRLSRVVVDALLGRPQRAPATLTAREREVVQLIADGRTTKEVARVLGVSVKTAESHRTRIMKKLDVHETAGLVRYAIREGLIQA